MDHYQQRNNLTNKKKTMKKPTILEKSFALLLAGVFLTFAIALTIVIFNHLVK